VSMKFCSGCKLIQYCCQEHQKQDWPKHKDICKCVQKLMKNIKDEHVFSKASSLPPDNQVAWNNFRVKLINCIYAYLNRPLTPVEMQMILYPPVCNYCHSYKCAEMFTCFKCSAVLYCCKEHQKQDKKHKKVCELLGISCTVDKARYFTQNSLLELLHFTNLGFYKNLKTLPDNMESLIKSVIAPPDVKILLSEILSFSLTLIHVLRNVLKFEGNFMIMHIVGAEGIEQLAVQAIPILYHLFPKVICIHIILIGPGVPDDDSIPLMYPIDNIHLRSVNMLYHEYVVSEKFFRPNLIATFNCGFCEFDTFPANDLWKMTLPHLLTFKKCILIVTSYTEGESASDIQRLLANKPDGLECRAIVKCQKNPFLSLYPHRDWENNDLFFQNSYISVIQPLSD